MTDIIVDVKPNRKAQVAGLGLAVLWVLTSVGQEVSWLYAGIYSIGCNSNGSVLYIATTFATTVTMVALSAAYFLKLGVRLDTEKRPGGVFIGVGLGISLALTFLPAFWMTVLYLGPEGPDSPPVTADNVVNIILVVAVFALPPIGGIASVIVAHSETTLARWGRANREMIAFTIAAVLTIAPLVAIVMDRSVGCGNAGWVFWQN